MCRWGQLCRWLAWLHTFLSLTSHAEAAPVATTCKTSWCVLLFCCSRYCSAGCQGVPAFRLCSFAKVCSALYGTSAAAQGPFLNPAFCRPVMLLRALRSHLSPRSNRSQWPPRAQLRRQSNPQVSVAAALLCAAPLQGASPRLSLTSVVAEPTKLLSDGESTGALASGLATAGMSAQPQTPLQVSHANLWVHHQVPGAHCAAVASA